MNSEGNSSVYLENAARLWRMTILMETMSNKVLTLFKKRKTECGQSNSYEEKMSPVYENED